MRKGPWSRDAVALWIDVVGREKTDEVLQALTGKDTSDMDETVRRLQVLDEWKMENGHV